jgi:hypothetical protein
VVLLDSLVNSQGMPSLSGTTATDPKTKEVINTDPKPVNKVVPKSKPDLSEMCGDTLEVIGGIEVEHKYFNNYKNELVSKFLRTLGDKIIFKNKDVDNCPIKTCQLLKKGCKSPYLGNNLISH